MTDELTVVCLYMKLGWLACYQATALIGLVSARVTMACGGLLGVAICHSHEVGGRWLLPIETIGRDCTYNSVEEDISLSDPQAKEWRGGESSIDRCRCDT